MLLQLRLFCRACWAGLLGMLVAWSGAAVAQPAAPMVPSTVRMVPEPVVPGTWFVQGVRPWARPPIRISSRTQPSS